MGTKWEHNRNKMGTKWEQNGNKMGPDQDFWNLYNCHIGLRTHLRLNLSTRKIEHFMQINFLVWVF